jgi:hypothetical protein
MVFGFIPNHEYQNFAANDQPMENLSIAFIRTKKQRD